MQQKDPAFFPVAAYWIADGEGELFLPVNRAWVLYEVRGVETDDIVVELANERLGEGWPQIFIEKANQGGIG